MNYKEALKAAIDGHKVRCVRWNEKDESYVRFDGFSLYLMNDKESYCELFNGLNIHDQWEIVKPEPKFSVGEPFVAYGVVGVVTDVGEYLTNDGYKYTVAYTEYDLFNNKNDCNITEQYMQKINITR